MNAIKVDTAALNLTAQEAETVQALRAALPGQNRAARRVRAEAEFGLSYSSTEINERVRKSLPRRFLRERSARWTFIENYMGHLPDAALVRYHTAKTTGLFSHFAIVEPTYGAVAQSDPWLIGILDGRDHPWPDVAARNARCVVLAYW